VGRRNVLVWWGGKGLAVATAAGILLSRGVILRSREVTQGEGTRGHPFPDVVVLSREC